MKCQDIEIAIANFFGSRLHTMVPNISWGLGLHECDMLILNKLNHYATEVEIKISKADLKKDAKKKHTHDSNKIRRLFFAIPEKMFTDDVISIIPAHAGILVIKMREAYKYTDLRENHKPILVPEKPVCRIGRNAKINKSAHPLSNTDVMTLGRLGMIRYWNIRNKVNLLPVIKKTKALYHPMIIFSNDLILT
jgi:hypothetical protein